MAQRKAAKRERIDTGKDKRFVRRGAQGPAQGNQMTWGVH